MSKNPPRNMEVVAQNKVTCFLWRTVY